MRNLIVLIIIAVATGCSPESEVIRSNAEWPKERELLPFDPKQFATLAIDISSSSALFGRFTHYYDFECAQPLIEISETGMRHLDVPGTVFEGDAEVPIDRYRLMNEEGGRQWILAQPSAGWRDELIGFYPRTFENGSELVDSPPEEYMIVHFESGSAGNEPRVYTPGNDYLKSAEYLLRQCPDGSAE